MEPGIHSSSLIEKLLRCRGLIDDHVAQLPGYLRASRLEHRLLINFGGPKLQDQKVYSYGGQLSIFACLFVA